MDIYNSYLIGLERELAIEAAEMDATFHKLDAMYESIESNLSIMREQAELKVFKESGSYDDLAYLYTEAENEANQQKQGILQAILGAIKSIWSAIKGKFSKVPQGDPNEQIEIPSDLSGKITSLLKFWENLKSGISKLKSGQTGSGVLDMIKGLAVPAAATAAGVQGVKMARSAVTDLYNKVKGISDEVPQQTEEVLNQSNLDENTKKTVMDRVKAFSSAAKGMADSIFAKLTGNKNKQDSQQTNTGNPGDNQQQTTPQNPGESGGNQQTQQTTSGTEQKNNTSTPQQPNNTSDTPQNQQNQGQTGDQNSDQNQPQGSSNGSKQNTNPQQNSSGDVTVKVGDRTNSKQFKDQIEKEWDNQGGQSYIKLKNGTWVQVNKKRKTVLNILSKPPKGYVEEGYLDLDDEPTYYESVTYDRFGNTTYGPEISEACEQDIDMFEAYDLLASL